VLGAVITFAFFMVLAAGLCFIGLAFEVMVDDGRVWRKYCLCTFGVKTALNVAVELDCSYN
jgi:hypothetical protein